VRRTWITAASVHLHGEKTDVIKGEDILLKLAAVNLITKPVMHVQVIITPPSGMSVTSSEFVTSGAGLFTASYEIEPGVGRDIEVKLRSNQVGDFVVNGRIVYYFGDDIDGAEDHTLTLPITVRGEGDLERMSDTSGSEGSSTPGFAAIVAVIGLLTAYLRRKKI
jgi:PGF-CTERM protein